MIRLLRVSVGIVLTCLLQAGHAATWNKLGGFTFTDTLTASSFDYNVKSRALAAGWNGTTQLNATITVEATGVLYASSADAYAFDTGGGFPFGSVITLVNKGLIVGRGGAGGGGNGFSLHCGWTSIGSNGADGGPALLARHAITINNTGTIGGGGGGGGGGGTAAQNHYFNQFYASSGSGGGGGAGIPGGAGGVGAPGCGYGTLMAGYAGSAGTPAAGGVGGGWVVWVLTGGAGGTGGGLGQAGATGSTGIFAPTSYGGGYDFVSAGTAGGAGGYSVVGSLFVTWGTVGTVLGPSLF